MISIKNVSPGVLLIADRQLRLEPGRVVEIESLSPEAERALALGLLVRLGREKPTPREIAPTKAEATPVPEEASAPAAPEAAIPPSPAPPTPDDLSKLSPAEALDRIAVETDPARLRAWLSSERRRGISDAIRKRISEATVAVR